MRLNGLRLEIILAVFAALAAAVFGADWLVSRYQVERPLVGAASSVDGVRRAELVRESGRVDLVVTMGPARDFRASYQQLSDLLARAYGRNGGRVVVRDNRTARLTRALYEMNFTLQEGLATGRFSAMRAAVEDQARTLGLDQPYLWVEDGRIYLGLRDGKAVLYAVLERRPAPPVDPPGEGGGPLG
ncbi:MAG: hypothetical protein QME79_08235 [Bacillota bacterium]|nr:hypothetical protein [Bacillota bacterium]